MSPKLLAELNRAQAAEDVVVSPAEAIEPPTDSDDRPIAFERELEQWASDVWWAFKNFGSKMTKAQAGTASRWGIFKYAKDNPDAFMGTVVPKATAALEKIRDKLGDGDEVATEERKGIKELKAILVAAIAEAAEGPL